MNGPCALRVVSAKTCEAIGTVECVVARQASGEKRVVFGLATIVYMRGMTTVMLAIIKRHPYRPQVQKNEVTSYMRR